MPPNGRLATNLILANENVADHLTHFYLFFMPDFAREVYVNEPWYQPVVQRFRAVSGHAAREMLPARADFMHLMGLMAGKWPHSLALQPGGCTRPLEVQEQTRIFAILYAFRRFLENCLYGDTLENIIQLKSFDELENWRAQRQPESSDFAQFLHVAESLQLETMGRASDIFMSYGAYQQGVKHLFRRGVWHHELQQLDPATIREDISHSWMRHGAPRHPFVGVTEPDINAADGYTWCKAPRLDGRVVEVGALARQVVDGNLLIQDIVKQSGGCVRNRIIARLLEIARVVVAMESWVKELHPGEPWCDQAAMPAEAKGCGLVEAARGSLGHWVHIKRGRIVNYQIIAPTTWNFSPRDEENVPGALEQALIGAPVREGEEDPVAVQHIVRSFDPCMVCTVH
jgi:hydrogenase large subunit